MSSTGATLSGSFAGATSVPSAAGFRWGTSQENLSRTVSAAANSTGGSLAAAIYGLSAGTTYYYQAFVTVSGSGDHSSESSTIYGAVCSFTTRKVATASVTTGAATLVGQATATLGGFYTGASGKVDYTGFVWGLSQSSMNGDAMGDSTASPFSATLTGLSENTTYYYQAYVGEYNEESGDYEFRYGNVKTFTTSKASPVSTYGYLECYEVPDIISSLSGEAVRADSRDDRDDLWYRYYTNNSSRQLVTHTYKNSSPAGKQTRNFTVLYDETRYAPVWTAHAMHKGMWPDNNVGRSDNSAWASDPGISLTQQSGLNNASTVGYSRGHLVASNYRQTTSEQNSQTFYYSNQAPQWQDKFNSGVWSSLEQRVAALAPEVGSRDTLYVVTGVLYEGEITTKKSGSLDVPIPSHFYKCIMKCSFNTSGAVTDAKGIAFVYTNEPHYDSYDDSGYVRSIDSVEARAGFDFFPRVPSTLQEQAESNTNPSWFTTGSSSYSSISPVGGTDWGTKLWNP